MKTLAEVLQEADPLGPLNNELRVAVRERRRARPMIANGPGTAEHMPKRRAAMATIFALALGGVAAIVFNWPYPMDVVGPVRTTDAVARSACTVIGAEVPAA